MVSEISTKDIYYKAVATFGKLDAKDGQTDNSISLRNEGKKYAKADLDGDKKVSLGEFVIFELQRDPTLAQQFIYFRKLALKAKWDEAKINLFIGMLFDGAGDGILAVLQEINACLYFDEKWGIKTLFRIGALEYIDKQGQKENYLSLIKSSPQTAMKKLVYLLNLVVVVDGYYQSYMYDADNQQASKKLVDLLKKMSEAPVETRQQRKLLWACVASYAREGMDQEVLGNWLKEISEAAFIREQDCDFAFWAIAVRLIKTPAQLKDVQGFTKDLPAWKIDVLTKLVRNKYIKSLNELKEIARRIEQNDSSQVVNIADFESDLPSMKEAGIILVLVNFLQQEGEEAAKKALDYIGQTKEEGVRWEVVLRYTARGLGLQHYKLIDRLAEELEREMPKEKACLEEISAFFRKIPTWSLYEIVESLDGFSEKRERWMKQYSDKAAYLPARIFMQDEKNNYALALSENLEAQGMADGRLTGKDAFYVPIEIIDYDHMIVNKMGAKYYILGKNRVLVSIDVYGKQVYKVVNPNSKEEMIQLMEEVCAILSPDQKVSAAGYFPMVTFEDDHQYSISLSYIAGREIEKASAEKAAGNPINTAYKVFTDLFRKEGAMLREEVEIWENLLPKESLQVYLWNEKPIDRNKLNAIIEIMGNQGAFATTLETFGISEKDYQKYIQGILDLLSQASQGRWQLTREAFLIRAIEVCDGNVMLASVITYNVLWERKWTFLKDYPDAFTTEGMDAGNAGGTIYHFYGMFFAAYATQVSLVDRYQNDEQFRREIDAEADVFQKNIRMEGNKVIFEIALDKTTCPVRIDLLTQKLEFPEGITGGKKNMLLFKMLLYLQYQMLREDGGSSREIISLCGTFYEQMIEDGGDAEDFPGDFRGMLAGHAFFQLVHDRGVEIGDDNREILVKFLGKYVGADSPFSIGDAMNMLDLLAPRLKDEIIKKIWGKFTGLLRGNKD